MDSPLRGFLLYVPEVYEENIQGYEDIDRNTITTSLTHRPFGMVYAPASLSAVTTPSKGCLPYGRRSRLSAASTRSAVAICQTTNTSYPSADYAATARAQLRPTLGFETAAGFQYYQKKFESEYASAQQFAVSSLETITSGAVKTSQENFLENKTSACTCRNS